MSYDQGNLENRFEEFVEETEKRIKELEQMIRILRSELESIKKENIKINITNQDIKSSLGATFKSVGDIAKGTSLKDL